MEGQFGRNCDSDEFELNYDFSHNRVEVRIAPTIEDYFIRMTYPGDVYGSEFLLSEDKLIKYVLND